VFLARDASGTLQVLLLTGMGREILDSVAEPVTVRGELQRCRHATRPEAEPSTLHRE
jgi:hypothetical protein